MSENLFLSFVRVSGHDNVAVLPEGGCVGGIVCGTVARESIPPLHKIALSRIKEGEPVMKYGVPIGEASRDIAAGDWVHSHNLRQITGAGIMSGAPPRDSDVRRAGPPDMKFMGFRRSGGIRPGIRNALWVISLDASILGEIRYILSAYHKPYWIDSVHLIDYRLPADEGAANPARDILAGLTLNPNVAGVLFAGLEDEYPSPRDICEQAQAEGCRALPVVMGQSEDDIIPRLLDDLAAASPRVREEFPVSELCVGVTGGGGMSYLTANPLLGFFAEWLTGEGGTVLAAGVPEVFRSAAVANRVASGKVLAKYMAFAARFADNALLSDLPGYLRNGLRDGITTPEERALSVLPINGETAVTGFLEHAEAARNNPGVTITHWTGSPPSDCTAFVSAGAQMIQFATEHGTPFGSVVPTVKISAVTAAAQKHPAWIDFDAGVVLSGEPAERAAKNLVTHVLEAACGARCSHEKRGCGDMA